MVESEKNTSHAAWLTTCAFSTAAIGEWAQEGVGGDEYPVLLRWPPVRAERLCRRQLEPIVPEQA